MFGRLVFKPPEGKVSLKGGHCPGDQFVGGMELWISSVEWWKAVVGLVKIL